MKWNKPGIEGQTPHFHLFAESKTIKLAEAENKMVVTGGQRWGEVTLAKELRAAVREEEYMIGI